MIRLRLVRHGQSTWNVVGRLQGQAMDVPLTELGRDQARAAADRLRGEDQTATVLYCSDQRRAVQTARIIGNRLGLQPVLTDLLREQGRGVLEGRPLADLIAEPVPEGLDISEIRWGGGESVVDVMERLQSFVDMVRAGRAKDVIAVSHGDTMCILLAMLDGRHHRDVDWTLTTNGGVVERFLD